MCISQTDLLYNSFRCCHTEIGVKLQFHRRDFRPTKFALETWPRSSFSKFGREVRCQNLAAKFAVKIWPRSSLSKFGREVRYRNLAAKFAFEIWPRSSLGSNSTGAIFPAKFTGCFVLFVGCLTSQQYASVSQGPTSPSADPITPGAWQGSHWSASV